MWAVVFASGGFMLGSVLERMLGHIEHYETYLIATVVGVAMLISATHLVIVRRMAKARQNGAGRKGDGS
jgi:membrane protein DedA with SNARE-associated domain